MALYYAIACAISWALWSPLVLGREGLGLIDNDPSMGIFISLGTLGPLVAAYVAHRYYEGNWRAVRFLPPKSRDWLWVVAGPLLVLFSLFVVLPALLSEGPPNTWRWQPGVLAGILVPMFNYNLFGGPLFEEFGWRGFAQSRLQRDLPPWIAASVVGVLWASWHLPLFFVKGWSSAAPAVYVLLIADVSVVIAIAFNASGQSILTAILMHSAFNSSSRFIGPYLGETATRSTPAGEWYLAAAFLLVGAALVIVVRAGNVVVGLGPQPGVPVADRDRHRS